MRIAIIGAGISGLAAAYYLARRHEVTLFEKNDYCGGHANTARVREGGREIPIDTGFIVFNQRNYPNLCRLFDELGVASVDTDMSFSVRCEQSGLEYNGTSFNKLFAQRKNIVNLRFWRMLKDINRFNKEAVRLLDGAADDRLTVEEFVKRHDYSPEFLDYYLAPLGASLWSSPAHRFRQFPLLFVVEFLHNHCMLQLGGRPRWKTVKAGSREYVKKLTRGLQGRIRLGEGVEHLSRQKSGVELATRGGRGLCFDEAIVCCHPDQALRLLHDPDDHERAILGQFRYQQNEAVLHTDTGLLPNNKSAWASWNYRIPKQSADHVAVTYNMNKLQRLATDRTYCVSLNQTRQIERDRILKRIIYHHPQFSPGRAEAQACHADLIRRRRVSYCGAYWGYGFHEDGVRSALNVCAAFDPDIGVSA